MAALGLGLALSLAAAQGCSPKGGQPMPPDNAQKPAAALETKDQRASRLVANTMAVIKAWKSERDVARDFMGVSVQLDALCRQGKGKDVMRLHDGVFYKLIELDGRFSVTRQDLHRTVWKQIAASRTGPATFTGLFLALPMIGDSLPKQVVELPGIRDGEKQRILETIDGILDEAGKSGKKFRVIAQFIKNGYADRAYNSDNERALFFENLRLMYLKPAEPEAMPMNPATRPKKVVPAPASMQEKAVKIKMVPLKKAR